MTSDMLKNDLEASGVNVNASTVRRHLLEAGLRARRPLKKQLLTKAMTYKRYQWAKQYKHFTKDA